LPVVDDWVVTSTGEIALLRGRDYHIDWMSPDGTHRSSPKVAFDWKRMTDEQKVALIDSVKAIRDRAAAANPGQGNAMASAFGAALGMGEPQRLSYAELEARVDAIAAQLLGLGLRRGEIVLVQLPNVWEGVALYLAAARLGLVLSPVAIQYRRHELEQIGRLLQPRVVVTCREFKGFDQTIPVRKGLLWSTKALKFTQSRDGYLKLTLGLSNCSLVGFGHNTQTV
jgi:non-ribosomal peptide synthetase component F